MDRIAQDVAREDRAFEAYASYRSAGEVFAEVIDDGARGHRGVRARSDTAAPVLRLISRYRAVTNDERSLRRSDPPAKKRVGIVNNRAVIDRHRAVGFDVD